MGDVDVPLFPIKRLIFSAVAFSFIDDNVEAASVFSISDFKNQEKGLYTVFMVYHFCLLG